jgi:acyl-CoA dehydrogenase
MDFEFTEEQEMLRRTIREWGKKEWSLKDIREIDEKGEFPHEAWRQMAELGLIGTCIPENYGGSSGGIIEDVINMEELAQIMPAFALAYSMTIWAGLTFIRFGTEQQKQDYLPQIAKGKLKFALGLTEPSGGTDVLSLSSFAEPDGDDYVLHGQKMFTSLALVSDYILIVARTIKNPSKRHQGLTVFIVDAHSPDLEIIPIHKMCNRSIDTNQLFFDGLRVNKDQIVGEVDNGWRVLVAFLNHERIGTGALTLGLSESAFKLALQYAKDRYAFNRPIGQYQAIQRYLAEMATGIEIMRLLTYKAAWLESQGKRCDVEAVMAKMVCSETAFKVVTYGMDILGGYGVTMDYDMQRYFRDSRHFTFAPISNEMARNYIAESFGVPKSY